MLTHIVSAAFAEGLANRHEIMSQGGPAEAAAAAVSHSCAWCLQAFHKDAAGRTLKLWLDLQTAVSALYDSSLGSKYADKAPVSTDH